MKPKTRPRKIDVVEIDVEEVVKHRLDPIPLTYLDSKPTKKQLTTRGFLSWPTS